MYLVIDFDEKNLVYSSSGKIMIDVRNNIPKLRFEKYKNHEKETDKKKFNWTKENSPVIG